MTRRRVTPVDWLMLVLAIVSVAMLAYETWGPVTPEQSAQILLADLIIVAIFAFEFTVRWIKDDRPKTFLLRNWYEVLGMIPVSHPAIRGFRLFRIIRIAVILSRFGRALDRTFGEEFTARVLGRFKRQVVETVGDAVTLRFLDFTGQVLENAKLAQGLADGLDEHGDEMVRLVVEKAHHDPELGAVRHLPFFEPVVETTGRVARRVVVAMLRDPRMDAILRDLLRDNLEKAKHAVRETSFQEPSTPPATKATLG